MPILKNARREKFAQCVVKGMTQDAAFVKAGYKPSRTHASKLRYKADVAARIDELKEAAAERALVSVDDVVKELMKVGFANMADYMTGSDGNIFTDLQDLTRDQASVLSEVTVETGREGRGDDTVQVRKVKFKLHDKLAALDKIARYLGMFKEKLELTGPNGEPLKQETTVIILPSNGRDAPANAAD